MGRGRGRGRGQMFNDGASIASTAASIGPQGAQPNPSQPIHQANISHNPNTTAAMPDTTARFADLNIESNSQQPTGQSSSSSSDSVPLETFRFSTTQKTLEHCKLYILNNFQH